VWKRGVRIDVPFWRREYKGKAAEHALQLAFAVSFGLVVVGIPMAWSFQRIHALDNRVANAAIFREEQSEVKRVWDEVGRSLSGKKMVSRAELDCALRQAEEEARASRERQKRTV
jgi:hypothetical protein